MAIVESDLILRGVGRFARLEFLLREERLEKFGVRNLCN